MNAFGAYIYAGGFSIGVSKYFDILGHYQDNTYAEKTREANFPYIPTYHDLEQLKPKVGKNSKIDFVYSNPPCAPWSQVGANHGKHAGWATDKRLDNVRHSFACADILKPSVFAWESVTNAFFRGRDFVDEWVKWAYKRGYSVTHLLIDAQYMGVCQVRKRYFFLAHKYELPFVKLQQPVTVASVLKGYKPKIGKELGAAEADRCKAAFKKCPEGGRLHEYMTGNPKTRPSFCIRRLHGDRPAFTITGFRIVHPSENRFLTPDEMGMLCGYPKDYKWECGPSMIPSQMARAVMPGVGKWLAKSVKDGIEEGRKPRYKEAIVDLRSGTMNKEVLK